MRPQPPHAGLGPALPLERAHEVHARRVLLRSEQTGGVFTASTPTAVGGAPREPRSRPGRSAQDRSPELTGPDGGSLPRSLPADRATPSGSDTLACHVWTRRLSKPGALSSAPPPPRNCARWESTCYRSRRLPGRSRSFFKRTERIKPREQNELHRLHRRDGAKPAGDVTLPPPRAPVPEAGRRPLPHAPLQAPGAVARFRAGSQRISPRVRPGHRASRPWLRLQSQAPGPGLRGEARRASQRSPGRRAQRPPSCPCAVTGVSAVNTTAQTPPAL